MPIKEVNIVKVEEQFEASLTFTDGTGQSKVFDTFEDANDWVTSLEETKPAGDEPAQPKEEEVDAEGTEGEADSKAS